MSRIEFIATREHRTTVPIFNYFEFVPKAQWGGLAGRLHLWLLRKAWAFLGWRGALRQAMTDQISYTRHVIDTDDVVKRLFEQRSELLRMHRTPREVLIGRDDFEELLNTKGIERYIEFNAQILTRDADDVRRGWMDRGEKVLGLKIRVIPWMSGMVVMP